MLSAVQILPQYGSISVATLRHTYLVGSGQNVDPPKLEAIGVFDTVLGTPPEVLQKDIRRFSTRDALEGLAALKHIATEGLSSEIDSAEAKATVDVRQGGLGLTLCLQNNELATTGYEFTLSKDHLKAFLKASLRHYAGALAPRGQTILEDRLIVAANLIYHQQFAPDEESTSRPPIPERARLVSEIEMNSDADFADVLLAVRVPDPENTERDLLHLSVNEAGVYTLVLKPPGEHKGLWPLKKNVLMLGATVMHAPGFYPHFLDLMGLVLSP